MKNTVYKLESNGKSFEYLRSEAIKSERKTLLIFHGIATTAELMEDEVRHFEKDFNVIAPTLNHVSSFRQWSEVVNVILETEGIERVFVKGASFGGIVAQAYYHTNHSKIDGLILVNTLPPQPKQAKDDKKVLMLLNLFPLFLFKKLMMKKLDALFQVDGIDQDGIEKVKSIKLKMTEILSKKIKKSHLKTTFMLLYEFDSDIKYLNTQNMEQSKKLFITSNSDPSYARVEEIKKKYPGISVEQFDNVGHLLPVLKQDEYLGLISDFVNKCNFRIASVICLYIGKSQDSRQTELI